MANATRSPAAFVAQGVAFVETYDGLWKTGDAVNRGETGPREKVPTPVRFDAVAKGASVAVDVYQDAVAFYRRRKSIIGPHSLDVRTQRVETA